MSVRNDEGPVPLGSPYWDWAEDPSKLSFKKFFLEWARVHDIVTIWDYWTNFSPYLAPMPNMDVIADSIRFFTEHGVAGIFAEDQGTERDAMRNWVSAKLLWDPSRNVRELMQDFIWGYYGKAAPAIVEYDEALRRTAEEHRDTLNSLDWGIRYPMDVEFLSPEFLQQAKAAFDHAESLAESEEIRQRVEMARLPVMYVELSQLHKQRTETGKLPDQDYFVALLDRLESITQRESVDVAAWIQELREAVTEHGG